MIYAVVAQGISLVTKSWADVERVRAIYPYPKWQTCKTPVEASEFVKRYANKFELSRISNYGDTISGIHVSVSYEITDTGISYVINTKQCGRIRVRPVDNSIVSYDRDVIHIQVTGIKLNPDMLSSHMAAVFNVYEILGDYVDVNLVLPNFSVYYALTSYTRGNVRAIRVTSDRIKERLCKTAYSLSILEE